MTSKDTTRTDHQIRRFRSRPCGTSLTLPLSAALSEHFEKLVLTPSTQKEEGERDWSLEMETGQASGCCRTLLGAIFRRKLDASLEIHLGHLIPSWHCQPWLGIKISSRNGHRYQLSQVTQGKTINIYE